MFKGTPARIPLAGTFMVIMQPTVFQWFHEFLLHLLQRRIRVSFHLWKMQKLAWPWPLEKQPSLQVHQHQPKGVLKSGTNAISLMASKRLCNFADPLQIRAISEGVLRNFTNVHDYITFKKITFPSISLLIASSFGAIILHGPHQVAKKSTQTKVF